MKDRDQAQNAIKKNTRKVTEPKVIKNIEYPFDHHPHNIFKIITTTIIMKFLISALLASSAAAFAPSKVAQTSTSLNAFEGELGVQPPLGFFDPLGLLDDADQERFDRLRYVEVKHGRIAQLAFLGNIITRARVYLPGDIDYSGTSFDSIPNGWAAVDAIPQAGLLQIIGFVGVLELAVMKDVTGEAEFPGDFRNGALDFG